MKKNSSNIDPYNVDFSQTYGVKIQHEEPMDSINLIDEEPTTTSSRPWYNVLASGGITLGYWTVIYPLFFLQQELVDGFDFGEAIEQITHALNDLFQQQQEIEENNPNEDLTENLTYFYLGLGISFLSSVMLTITFIHYNQTHHHEHSHEEEADTEHQEHAHSDSDDEESSIIPINVKKEHHHHHHHHHSGLEGILHQGVHYLTIGLPFGLIAFSASWDVILQIDPNANLALIVPTSSLSGVIAAFGAEKVHGHFADEASHGEGIKGFLKTVIRTFTVDVKGPMNLWKKYGILLGHGFEGYFAAELFTYVTGLNQFFWVDLPLKIILPLEIMVFEGLTESISVDKQLEQDPRFIWSNAITPGQRKAFFNHFILNAPIESVKWLTSTLHAVPVVLGATSLGFVAWETFVKEAFGPTVFGATINDGFVQLALFGAATLALLYPNASGFKALIDKPVDNTLASIGNFIKQSFSCCMPRDREPQIKYKKHRHNPFSSCTFSAVFCCIKKRNTLQIQGPVIEERRRDYGTVRI